MIVKNKSNYLRLGMRVDFHGITAWKTSTPYLFWKMRKNYDIYFKGAKKLGRLEGVQWRGVHWAYLSPHNDSRGFPRVAQLLRLTCLLYFLTTKILSSWNTLRTSSDVFEPLTEYFLRTVSEFWQVSEILKTLLIFLFLILHEMLNILILNFFLF